jgi:hypothetical protein
LRREELDIGFGFCFLWLVCFVWICFHRSTNFLEPTRGQMEKEIVTRDEALRAAAKYGIESLDRRARANGAPLSSWLRGDQKFFVYNAAHANTRIKSPDGEAWIRPIGFFPTLARAKESLKQISEHEDLEMRVQPTGKVFLIGKDVYHDSVSDDGSMQLDMPAREREQAKANALIQAAEALGNKKIEDVSRRTQQHEAGLVDRTRTIPSFRAQDLDNQPQPRPDVDLFTEAHRHDLSLATTRSDLPTNSRTNTRTDVQDFPAWAERRGQKYAVFAVIGDVFAKQESISIRDDWWMQRCYALRIKWCNEVGASQESFDWQITIADWLKENPAPATPAKDRAQDNDENDNEDNDTNILLQKYWDTHNRPLYVSPRAPKDMQAWATARDEMLLRTEWSASSRSANENFPFDYAIRLSEDDVPPCGCSEEPAIISVGACESLEEAEKLADSAAGSPELFHADVYVSNMYTWGNLSKRHEAKVKRGKDVDLVVPKTQE